MVCGLLLMHFLLFVLALSELDEAEGAEACSTILLQTGARVSKNSLDLADEWDLSARSSPSASSLGGLRASCTGPAFDGVEEDILDQGYPWPAAGETAGLFAAHLLPSRKAGAWVPLQPPFQPAGEEWMRRMAAHLGKTNCSAVECLFPENADGSAPMREACAALEPWDSYYRGVFSRPGKMAFQPCAVNLLSQQDVANGLASLRAPRLLFFGDSFMRRVSSYFEVRLASQDSVNMTLELPDAPLTLEANKNALLAAPWLKDGWSAFVQNMNFNGLTFMNRTLDLATRSYGTLGLVVVGWGIHVAPLRHDVAELDRGVRAAVDLLRSYFAEPDGAGGWRWHTKVLWLLPHKQDDTKKSPEHVERNGNAAITEINVLLRTRLAELRVPFLDTFAFSVGMEDETVDGTHYSAKVDRVKAMYILNYLLHEGA